MNALRHFAAAAVAFAALTVSAGTVYLDINASGTGDGSSWANACTTMANAITALNAAGAGSELRIAEGEYVITAAATISVDGFSITGGWYDDDGTWKRDSAEHESIVTPNKSTNCNFQPLNVTDTSFAQIAINDQFCCRNGKIRYLDEPEKSYGCGPQGICTYRSSSSTITASAFVVPSGVGGTFDGLWFYAFIESYARIAVDAAANETTVKDCRFFYCNAGSAVSGAHKVIGCTFRGINSGNIVLAPADCVISNCYFRDVLGDSYNSASCILANGSGVRIEKTSFDRCHTYNQGKIGHLCHAAAGNAVTVSDCVVTNCHMHGLYDNNWKSIWTPSFFNLYGGGTIERTRFTRNRSVVYASTDYAYGYIAAPEKKSEVLTIDGCLFDNNVMTARVVAIKGNYVMGCVGSAFGGDDFTVRGCVFDSNAFQHDPADDLVSAPVVARGAFVSGATAKLAFVNNTVTGPVATGDYDIVQYGTAQTETLKVWNSIFDVTDADIRQGFLYAGVPALWDVRSCAVKNAYEAYRPADVDITTGLVLDPIMLGTDYAPQVRVPGLASPHLDGSIVPASTVYVGAVQTLPAAATGSNRYLVIRPQPFIGGTVDVREQNVPSGTKAAAVTATASSPATFDGWYRTDSEGEPTTLVSSSATLSDFTVSADTLLVAKFEIPKVSITFDLGSCGTFDDTGLATKTVEMTPGEALTVPAWTLDEDNWVFSGWSPELPGAVPTAATTYTAVAISKQLRVIRLVPAGTGGAVQDGQTWATAYDDFATAYADAATYRGELWIREGDYTVSTPIVLKNRVRIRGGFAGGETSADQADPANHVTVFRPGSGVKECFRNYSDDGTLEEIAFSGFTISGFGSNSIVIRGGGTDRITFDRVTVENSGSWGCNPCPVDVVNQPVTCRDCTFRRLGNGVRTTSNRSADVLAYTNCLFEGCNSGNYGAALYMLGGLYTMSAQPLVTDCTFLCNTGMTRHCNGGCALSIGGTGGIVDGCLFQTNYLAGEAQSVVSCGSVLVRRTRFVGNACNPSSAYAASVFSMSGYPCVADSCSFLSNVVSRSATGKSYACVAALGGNQALMLNSTFSDNTCTKAEGSAGRVATLQWGSHNAYFAVVNTTVANSTLSGENVSDFAFEDDDGSSHAYTSDWIINCIFENEDPDYQPIYIGSNNAMLRTAGSFVRNLDTNSFASVAYLDGLATNGTSAVSRATRQGANGVIALGGSGSLRSRARGVAVYRSENGRVAYYRNKNGTVYALPNGSAMSPQPTSETPCMPDAFDKNRSVRRVDPGPLPIHLGILVTVY